MLKVVTESRILLIPERAEAVSGSMLYVPPGLMLYQFRNRLKIQKSKFSPFYVVFHYMVCSFFFFFKRGQWLSHVVSKWIDRIQQEREPKAKFAKVYRWDARKTFFAEFLASHFPGLIRHLRGKNWHFAQLQRSSAVLMKSPFQPVGVVSTKKFAVASALDKTQYLYHSLSFSVICSALAASSRFRETKSAHSTGVITSKSGLSAIDWKRSSRCYGRWCQSLQRVL